VLSTNYLSFSVLKIDLFLTREDNEQFKFLQLNNLIIVNTPGSRTFPVPSFGIKIMKKNSILSY